MRKRHNPVTTTIVIATVLAVIAGGCWRSAATTETADDSASETAGSTADAPPTSEPPATVPPTTEPAQATDDRVTPVHADATFEVSVTTDIVYGQALSHQSWGSGDAAIIDLLVDVYEPVRSDQAVMPAVVMIHGGGFVSGSKEHGPLSEMAVWFAERGYVAYSINYRLADDVGTLPDGYPEPPVAVTDKQSQQWRALYPACRDAKAAIRWVRATADDYSIDPDHIAVVGGSAGSNLAIMLGASHPEDCVSEIDVETDPTLASTNLDQSSEVATVIDHWGGHAVLSMIELINGGGSRFDPSDAPVSIVHGTADRTVDFSEAERLRAEYEQTGVAYEWHPLDGAGHGAWRAEIGGRPLVESAAAFIVETQGLTVH